MNERKIDWLGVLLRFVSLIGAIVFVCGLYECFFIRPYADDNANKICQEQGFDFYESYSRVGLFSKEPIALRCKYVDQYRLIDINTGGDSND